MRGESGLLKAHDRSECLRVTRCCGLALGALSCAVSRGHHQELDGLQLISFSENCSILESPWLHLPSFAFALRSLSADVFPFSLNKFVKVVSLSFSWSSPSVVW